MSTNRRWSGYTLFPDCQTITCGTSTTTTTTTTTPSATTETRKKRTRKSLPPPTTSTTVRSDESCEGYATQKLDKSSVIARKDACSSTTNAPNNEIDSADGKVKRRVEHGQLIPLRLSSKSVTIRPASFAGYSSSRRHSTNEELFTIPEVQLKRRTGPVTHLIIVPYTEGQWTVIMNEVKDLHLKGQYKQCSMRCKQILDGIKTSYGIHPLYSIYLCFFAASSLEMTAASLHSHASTKLPLYQEALSYYQMASSHLEFAAFSNNPIILQAMGNNNNNNNNSSLPSSARSSVDSVFSHQSANSSVASSPYLESPMKKSSHSSSSASSSEDDERTLRTSSPRKKKVAFCLSSAPLSPGLQLMTPSACSDESMLLDAFPSPPTFAPSPTHSRASSPSRLSTTTNTPALTSPHHTRYTTFLASLSPQITYHITAIHTSIAHLSSARKTRRHAVLSFDHHTTTMPNIEGVSAEEVKRTAIKERVRCMREEGGARGEWARKRKRFDGERYRVLAERALEEVVMHQGGGMSRRL